MLGLPFVAVMPRSTSPEKIALIEREGGRCHLVDDPTAVYAEAARLAADVGGHYLDQFTYAERATDWRGNNNIAESIFDQLALERYPVPRWIVVGAGTGGTSATIGRYLRYRRHADLPRRRRSRRTRRSCRAGATTMPARCGAPFPDRGHRPAPRRAELRPRRGRPDDRRAGRRVDRHDAGGRAGAGTPGRGRPPAPTSAARCRSRPRCASAGWAAASSRCCATAASATPTPTTTTAGCAGSGLDITAVARATRRGSARLGHLTRRSSRGRRRGRGPR